MSDLPITSDNGATPVVINDPITPTNVANVKAALTAATAADEALVVTLSPNSPLPTGTNNIGVTGVTQGSTTAGEHGDLVQGAVTTVFPVYTTATTQPLSLNTRGALRVEPDFSSRSLYSGASGSIAITAAAPTDMITLTGSATKTIRILQVELSTIQSGAGLNTWFLLVRSTANAGGTSTTRTAVPMDSNNAAATATMRVYTVNPTTVGTLIGNIRTTKLTTAGTTASTAYQDVYVWDFTDSGLQQGIVLRGIAQVFAINFGGAPPASGFIINANITWSEE